MWLHLPQWTCYGAALPFLLGGLACCAVAPFVQRRPSLHQYGLLFCSVAAWGAMGGGCVWLLRALLKGMA